jgi:type I restriction enzyme S subunit
MVEGFKNTDAGIIPIDWDAPVLSEISDFENGKAHEQFIDDKGDFIVVNSKFISQDGRVAKYSKANLSPLAKGDIAIVMSDIPNGKALAKCFSVDKENRYTLNQRIGCIKPFEEIDNDYLFYKLNRNKYFLAFDSGSGQTNLKKSEILACPVALPPTKAEQTAIATAIRDADKLITQLEKLLTKKRNIKTGAMQELLKPKEGWEERTLHQLADDKKELFDDGDWIEAEHITDNGIRIIQTGNIGVGCYVEKENKKYIFEKSFYKLKCKLLMEGDLLICRLAEPAGRACVLPNIGESKIVTSVDVTIFRPRPEVANRVFLANLFSTSDWFNKVTERVGGTTHKRISRSALGKITISVPGITEQNKIAKILSDLDNEIQEIEKQLEKQKMMKQGMMQSLLTGKIRLINTKN